jgi:hypothetical protein
MSFHLEGPWLSTTGKKKGKQKWASAEAKAKAEKLEAEWKALQKRWGVEAEDKKRRRALSAPTMSTTAGPKVPPGRETARIESRDTGWIPCTKVADAVYTGTKIKGIGTMHKSNAVPVFSDEEAHDIAKMRR